MFTCVGPPEGGNFQPLMLDAMQLERPGKSFSPPFADTLSTLPFALIITVALTRALLGAFGLFASSAGCQHFRFTRGWFDETTPLISPALSWLPPLLGGGSVATGPGPGFTKPDVSIGADDGVV